MFVKIKMKTFYYAKHKDGRYLSCACGEDYYWSFDNKPQLFYTKKEIESIFRWNSELGREYSIEEVTIK